MTKLITDEDLAAVGLELCGDNSCVFGAPGGMGTNGGCRCDERNTDDRWPLSAKRAFKRAAALAHRIAKQRAELSAAFLNERSAMEREIATLRADLAASQRELERLRHGEATAEDGVCPDAVEVERLRAELRASALAMVTKNAIIDEALADARRLRADANRRVGDLSRLADEIKRCQEIFRRLVFDTCLRFDGTIDSDLSDPLARKVAADAIRYLAEIGRVEIVSEQGRRTVARWRS